MFLVLSSFFVCPLFLTLVAICFLLVGPLFGPGAGRCGSEAVGLGLGLGLGFGPAYRFAGANPGLTKGRCLLFDQGRPRNLT